jgi:hypothetical protein
VTVTLHGSGAGAPETVRSGAKYKFSVPPGADVRVIPQPCVQIIHHRAPGILSSSFHLPLACAAFR